MKTPSFCVSAMTTASFRLIVAIVGIAPSAALHARPWRVRAQRASVMHCNEAGDDATMSAVAANEALSADGESWSVLDVRMEAEYRLEGHIEGSVSLPSHSWEHVSGRGLANRAKWSTRALIILLA